MTQRPDDERPATTAGAFVARAAGALVLDGLLNGAVFLCLITVVAGVLTGQARWIALAVVVGVGGMALPWIAIAHKWRDPWALLIGLGVIVAQVTTLAVIWLNG